MRERDWGCEGGGNGGYIRRQGQGKKNKYQIRVQQTPSHALFYTHTLSLSHTHSLSLSQEK